MIVEAKVSYETKSKEKPVDVTDVLTKTTIQIPRPNDAWKATLIIDVSDNTSYSALVNKVKKYLVSTYSAIEDTVNVKKVSSLNIIKL